MANIAQENELSIFVGGLINTTTNKDLFRYFSQFGPIASCKAQMWKNNPAKCRGFAVLTAGDSETYENIMSRQHFLGGRYIECKPLVKDKSRLSSYCKEELDKRIYVSGLSKKVSDELLKEYFSNFGEVNIAYIVRHHKDQKPKGFGFVSFTTREGRENALAHQSHFILEKQVFCTEYSTKADLKKGTKLKTCADQEDTARPTSDDCSDEDTEANYYRGQSGYPELFQGGKSQPANQCFYSRELHEGCQDQKTTSDHFCPPEYYSDYQEDHRERTQLAASSKAAFRVNYYNPFLGSNGLLRKLNSNQRSHYSLY